jgi:hypothetical protein
MGKSKMQFSQQLNQQPSQTRIIYRLCPWFQSLGIVLCSVLGSSQMVQAQVTIPSNIADDLNAPNNSQQFFDRGRSRIEQEIHLLNQRYTDPESLEPILTLSPGFFEEQERLLQLQEGRVRQGGAHIRILEPDSFEPWDASP